MGSGYQVRCLLSGYPPPTTHYPLLHYPLFPGQVVQLVDTRRSERRALAGLGVRLSPWSMGVKSGELRVRRRREPLLALDTQLLSHNFPSTQVDQSPAGSHKPGLSGATPEPAIETLMSPSGVSRPSTQTSAKRPGREPGDFVGSTPTSVIRIFDLRLPICDWKAESDWGSVMGTIPIANRKSAIANFTRSRGPTARHQPDMLEAMVQLHPGSIEEVGSGW